MKYTNKLLMSALTSTILVGSVNADFLGAEAGYALWSPSLTGTINKSGANIDFEEDLGFGSKQNNSFMWAYLDHPIPLLPNIKIQQTNYEDSSNGKFTKSLNFAGKSYSASANSKTTFQLNQTDLIAYWRILDNWVNFDIGFNLKNLDGKIKIESANQTTDESFDAIVPMAYAKARFDLPFSGLSVEADISTIAFSGNKITDIKAGLSYDIAFGIGAVAGLRTQSLVLEDIQSVDADISISGIYAGLYYHF
jgi:outer membrane protein